MAIPRCVFSDAYGPLSVLIRWINCIGRKSTEECIVMNKDQIAGKAKKFKGAVMEKFGKATGNTKLETDGKIEKAAGNVQNATGEIKEALKNG